MTLWRKPELGETVRNVSGMFVTTVRNPHHWDDWEKYKEKWEFVTVTPIEPPPEPLKRTVYVPVFKVEGRAKIVPGQVVFNSVEGQFAKTGEEAKKATSGFAHRVGIIKVELVEGQYDE